MSTSRIRTAGEIQQQQSEDEYDWTVRSTSALSTLSKKEQNLSIAFYTFFTFTCIQSVYAMKSNSASLLADTIAMFIDSFTYLLNLVAEYFKSDNELRNLYLELIPPLTSVCILLALTFMTLQDSVLTLWNYFEHDVEDQEPDSSIMIVFATGALFIDLFNMIRFQNTSDDEDTIQENFELQEENVPILRNFSKYDSTLHTAETGTSDFDCADCDLCRDEVPITTEADCECALCESNNGLEVTYGDNVIQKQKDDDSAAFKEMNLNMYSAFTHVFADTMRSTAVLIAGCTCHLYPDWQKSFVIDSVAAIIVSLTIVCSCMPLMSGLMDTWNRIREMKKQ